MTLLFLESSFNDVAEQLANGVQHVFGFLCSYQVHKYLETCSNGFQQVCNGVQALTVSFIKISTAKIEGIDVWRIDVWKHYFQGAAGVSSRRSRGELNMVVEAKQLMAKLGVIDTGSITSRARPARVLDA